MNAVLALIVTGVGATVVMDVWGVLRKRLFGIPPADYAMVGRWIGHMVYGTLRHDRIGAAVPIPRERIIGWTAHYATGVAFAAGLIWIVGLEWLDRPTLVPALAFGICTVAAPFLLMQPGMGAGLALQSLITHGVFGFGLWLAAWVRAAATN
jgi:hypothetical protein